MKPVALDRLLSWMITEYSRYRSIFGIAHPHLFRKQTRRTIDILDGTCDTALGPAAGPHTQLAPNIVAAFLCGGRFFELKTVQKNDRLDIAKPCIDVRDEGYNTEWSTELSLEQAYAEYIKAWFLLHVLEAVFDLRATPARSFQFNMSVGYDLEGIQSQPMDTFIRQMAWAADNEFYQRTRHQLIDSFRTMPVHQNDHVFALKRELVLERIEQSSAAISPSVTLSTMHGCPPDQVRAIATYLLTEKHLHTSIKLNPTLLGYDKTRALLDQTGFDYIMLEARSFEQDLHYETALELVRDLSETARSHGRVFGIKLSNTLGVVNTGAHLPGHEMYLSGRALYPLTVTLAARLARDIGVTIPLSYCGGLAQDNVGPLFEAGVRPLTVATELLKPGGYYRLTQMARTLEELPGDWESKRLIDPILLERLAEQAPLSHRYHKSWRGWSRVRIDRVLPLFDCFTAPCVNACPIHQDIPDYIRLSGQSRYRQALELIYDRNPLPHITAMICDHQCQDNCTRLDYDQPVRIRDIKKIAAELGGPELDHCFRTDVKPVDVQTAIIGAGPAGLALSYFLARAGVQVVVFEKRLSVGGVVSSTIPAFRIPNNTIEQDLDMIKKLGVQFRFGVSPAFSIAELKKEGFSYVFIGIGAEQSNHFKIGGDTVPQVQALDFLQGLKQSTARQTWGRYIVVVGGGNTAMDSARAAKRLPGVERVSILYRRTRAEMPADPEEYENALRDGINFVPLTLPERYSKKDGLICRTMVLGPVDDSGRPRPNPSNETRLVPADLIILAIGEYVDRELLARAGLPCDPDGWPRVDPYTLETALPNVFLGGDAFRGPSTVIKAVADARTVADQILKRTQIKPRVQTEQSFQTGLDEPAFERITAKKAKMTSAVGEFSGGDLARHEAERCLECHLLCGKCVDVCPNRANILIRTPDRTLFRDSFQVLHLDYLCNECGNCATHCPYQDGRPSQHKFSVFADPDDLLESTNSGFACIGTEQSCRLKVRYAGRLFELECDADGWQSDLPENSIAEPGLVQALELIRIISQTHAYLLVSNR
ncbi:putative selenate reductase subunit YgfK [bacterium]|nr:putative selenate reductase subunit YgfK [bacterium]